MQTFLPFSVFFFYTSDQIKQLSIYNILACSFYYSLVCLDNKRLGKQRVEANQLIGIITIRKQFQLTGLVDKNRLATLKKESPAVKFGWINHPATLLWEDYLNELKLYYNLCIEVWKSRKNRNGLPMKNNMKHHAIPQPTEYTKVPWFLTNLRFITGHQSALLFKEPKHYEQYKWNVEPKLDYIWTHTNEQ